MRRTVITLVVIGCLAGVVFAFRAVDTDAVPDDIEVSGANPIEERIPQPESEILRQDVVGVDLQAGWTGVLILNDVEIPQDQLDTDNLASLGQVLYRVGDDTAVEFAAGRNCVTAVIWRVEESRENSRNESWCFNVT